MKSEIYNVKCAKSGTLRFGVPSAMASFDFPKIIMRFRTLYPDITLSIQEFGARSLENMIVTGDLDVAISLHPILPPDLSEIPLISDQFACAVAPDHPLAKKDSVSIQDLEPYPVNTWPEDFAFYQILISKFRENGLQITPNITCSNNDFLLSLSRISQDVCVLPRPVIKRHEHTGLNIIPFKPGLPWELCIVFKKNAPMLEKMRALILCMQSEIQ
ncbi:MAG: LysR family transcriptional regulator substrate-binding protein [Lachnospiraceae bacterium]|nr:LysR family transcriptional regulator substrate-binding protein [Lachnospiraceae bacterium]